MLKLILLLFCLFFSRTGFAAGVLAYKIRSNQPAPSASIILYRNLSESSRGSIIVYTADKAFVIERSQFVEKIEILDSLPPNIIDDTDVSKLRKQLESYQNFVNRFNRSKPLLEGFIEDLFRVIKGCEAGSVRFKDEWMSRDKMLSLKKIDENILSAQKEKAEIEAREKALFVESQKAKGLVFFNGKWMPVDDARSQFERQQRELAQLRKIDEDQKLLGKKAKFRKFKIIQVLNEGLLAECMTIQFSEVVSSGLSSSGGGGGVYVPPPYWTGNGTVCFVTNFSNKDLADGQTCEGWFADVGTYRYTDVRDAPRTVLKIQHVDRRYLPKEKK